MSRKVTINLVAIQDMFLSLIERPNNWCNNGFIKVGGKSVC